MKTLPLFLATLLCTIYVHASSPEIDSIKRQLNAAGSDSSKIFIYADLSDAFDFSHPDSSFIYARKGLALSQLIEFPKGEARCIYEIGVTLWITGNYVPALEQLLKSLEMQENMNDHLGAAKSMNVIGIVYTEQEDYRKGLEYYLKSKAIFESIKRDDRLQIALLNIGDCYEKLNVLDSALLFENEAYQLAIRTRDDTNLDGILNNLGNIHSKLENDSLAMNYYRLSIPYSTAISDFKILSETYLGMSNIFKREAQSDSSILYARKSLAAGRSATNPLNIMNASIRLSEMYEFNKVNDSAFHYYKMAIAFKDIMFDEAKVKKVQALSFAEQLRQQEMADEKLRQMNERQHNIQILGIGVFIITLFTFVMLLSRRKTKPRFIEFAGLLALLIFFEFITLLTHPLLEELTNNTPVLMLLILVCIAAVLVPTHHAMIRLMKEKLIYKEDAKHK
ncbi:MAG: tetratricopeptide repeat protein [Chitinophagaceae bacterium]|nr:tetratricopeptide repeat protein [Chitinophagaceae bacterium]